MKARKNDSAVLLITCPDQKGLVAAVSGELYRFGANIIHADQHQDHDAGLFFMRVEWSLGNGGGEAAFDIQAFSEAFAPIAARFGMDSQLHVGTIRPRVAIFVSQHLHCLADLLHRHQMGELDCEIPLIISNHTDGEALARFYGIPFHSIPLAAANKAEGEARQFALLESAGVDLIVLARYMQILSPEFVRRYPASVINVHHSFLPAFIGARPYHAAYTRGVKLIGATSHYVTEELDDGPIIEQDVTRISHRDQVQDLIAKGRDLERVVLSRAVRWHLDRRILRYGNKTVIFD
ncbi:formyltetrahydrofolate deformylase [Edaphobacter flagellatus]|uniref:formyltetrahydrofolate deformylase n=1 Tax=Edaphobacter flagellatus TaxID=1933044 RepID=UPI0021B2A0DB|nr:formyltetrahydrofolate deformylase [Edaphobacter flagellatus]